MPESGVQQQGDGQTSRHGGSCGRAGASAKDPSSPTQQHSNKLPPAVMSSEVVQLIERFPGIKFEHKAHQPRLTDEALLFTFEQMMAPALAAMSVTQHREQVAVVQILQQMVHPLMEMFKPSSSLELDCQLAETAIIDGDDITGHTHAFDKYLPSGAFRGKIEIQVVKKVMAKKVVAQHGGDGPACVFAGAYQAKRKGSEGRDLKEWMDQAMMEAFALWMNNARYEYYDKVWVVLTDVEQVYLVEYQGDKASVQRPFRVASVGGTMTVWGPKQLLIRHYDTYIGTFSSLQATSLMLHGLLGDHNFTKQELERRVEADKKEAIARVAEAIEDIYKLVNYNKRKRQEQDDADKDNSIEAQGDAWRCLTMDCKEGCC